MFSKKLGIVTAAGFLFLFPAAQDLIAQETLLQDQVTFKTSTGNGKLRMLHSQRDATIPVIQTDDGNIADAIKREFAPYFGVTNPATDLTVSRTDVAEANRTHIRYQQQHAGIPVLGGQLIANVHNQQLSSMSGEVATITLTDLDPDISPSQAQLIAVTAVAKWYQQDSRDLQTSQPELMIYDPALIGPANTPQALVWKLAVTSTQDITINELVLVDAHRGVIALHFSQIDTALNRATYTANGLLTLPGTLVCNESDPDCSAGDDDARYAHRFAADTYNYYFDIHGRDGIDDNGMTIISTTHYGSPQPNAFWNGTQIVYSDGFSVADDVVAHELTHGVTESTSNLFYYYQSGAINESFSDLWGEFVDLTNTDGTDTDTVRWQIGEDIPGIGAIRNMRNPTIYGDPDRMTSPLYEFDPNFFDNGGVHANSGINNKAVALLVDGGTFNSRNINALGLTKVAKLYYEVQTNYLTSGSDYLDLYNALNQACQTMIGSNGITESDCAQVRNATEAVEMHLSPEAGYNPEAQICPADTIASNFFYDNFETSLGNWTSVNLFGTNLWSRISGYATSGTAGVYAPGTDVAHDTILRWNNSISLPATGIYYIHFKHAFDFEATASNKYDGGVIEYSIDGGTTWIDAGSLIDDGRQYNGTLTSGTNPLNGRQAFTAYSNGYNSTRLNLSSLAGNNLRFRFRSTADSSGSSLFWIIDEFRIYRCITNGAPTANAGADQNANAISPVSLSGLASTDPDGDALTYQWTQLSGTTVNLTGANTATPSFVSPATMSTLIFRLTVTDSVGQSDTDNVTVLVNGLPIVNAGADQIVDIGSSVTLNGSGSDPEGNPISYNWTQIGGAAVTIASTTSAVTSFTAPTVPAALSFRLSVTDDRGQTATDTVTITTRDPAATTGGGGGGGGGCTVNANGRFDPVWMMLLLFFATFHLHNRHKTKHVVKD